MRLRLDGVHQIRELHRILDEEDRHVVADQIPVTLIGIELDGESTYVAGRVLRSTLTGNGRKTDEYRRDFASGVEQRGARIALERAIRLEETMRTRATRVNNALGDALVIEVGNLLAQDE